MAERSEAKSAKRSFASKDIIFFIFDAKLSFALFASLRPAILALLKWTTNWSFYPQGLKMNENIEKNISDNFRFCCFRPQ